MRGWTHTLVAILVYSMCAAAQVHAAQTFSGTMLSGTHESVVIAVDGSGKQLTVKPAAGASILRGQVGKQIRQAVILDLAPGDRVVAVVKQDGTATSIKAYYTVVRGTVVKVLGQKMTLRDGQTIMIRPGIGVVFGEGRIGKPSELKPGTLVLCRLNPTTREAWTVVATEPAAAPVQPTVKPVVKAVTYKGPVPLKVRDWVRVDLEGTPGGRATCQVKGLIPVTVMNEIEPGKYRAQVMIPGGKPVADAALIGRLTIGDAQSEPVQAAKLITIDASTLPIPQPQPVIAQVPPAPAPVEAAAPVEPAAPEVPPAPIAPEPAPVEPAKPESPPSPAPEPATAPAPAAVEPAPAPAEPPTAEPAPVVSEPPKVKAPVAIVEPADRSRIARSITVTGTAEPGSQVIARVSYSNMLSGILRMAGQVASLLLAVDQNGRFAMGPLPLEGPLATKGLVFRIEAFYPDSKGENAAIVTVYGDRN